MILLSMAMIVLAGYTSNTQTETTNGQIVALECNSTRTGTVTRRSGIVNSLTPLNSEFIVRLNSASSEAVIDAGGSPQTSALVTSETSYRFCAPYANCPDTVPMLNVSRRNGVITSQYVERDEFGSTYRFEENGQCELYTGPRF